MNKASELAKIESICEQISDLDLGIALVWVYVWDVIRSYYDDSDYQMKDKETVWNTLCEYVASGQGFTLEYGNESLTEHLHDWLIQTGMMIDLNDVEEEEENTDE